MTTERKKLIERLRECRYELIPYLLMRQAADMLEADAPAVPQEPVLYKYEHIYGYLPDQYSPTPWEPTWVEKWLETKLYAAPQPQPRLTDAEILTLWAQTYVERGTSGIEFARVIEAKVRGEA